MAALEKDWDDANEKKDAGSPDPETLYTKEYCIGLSHACFCSRRRGGACLAATCAMIILLCGALVDSWCFFNRRR